MLLFFTKELGKITAIARGAQRSRRRFGGALEPMHTLALELSGGSGDKFQLSSAIVDRPRIKLTSNLERLEVAARALTWVRKGALERDPEPLVWQLTSELLDRLNADHAVDAQWSLAAAGLNLLVAWGWALELDACVRCGRQCPDGKPAYVDASRGGLVCTACGGARTRLDAEQRARVSQASRGDWDALLPEDTSLVLQLTEAALHAHADIQ